jgi:hypothetical protein
MGTRAPPVKRNKVHLCNRSNSTKEGKSLLDLTEENGTGVGDSKITAARAGVLRAVNLVGFGTGTLLQTIGVA